MIEILNRIDTSLSEQKIVYIHCWGGVGRTGTVVGCYLMRHEIANEKDVLSQIKFLKSFSSLAHRESPETNEQKNFVLNWKKGQ